MNKKELIHQLTYEYADVADDAEIILHVEGKDYELSNLWEHYNNTERPVHINGNPIGPNESYIQLTSLRELRLTQ